MIATETYKKSLETLFYAYQEYQKGNKEPTESLINGYHVNKNKAFEELEAYNLAHSEDRLDAELYREQNEDKYKRRVRYFDNEVLNSLINRATYTYQNPGIDTKGKFKKYYAGEFDVSEIPSIMAECVIKVFSGKWDSEKSKKMEITDEISLAANIKYCFTKDINTINFDREDIILCGSGEEEIFDKNNLLELNLTNENDADSRYYDVYRESLSWLKCNNLLDLFKSGADELAAIVKTICDCKSTFSKKDDDLDYLSFITQEELAKLIESHCGYTIQQGNISRDLKSAERKILDFLFWGLNYKLTTSGQNRILNAVYPFRFVDLFLRESRFLYNWCNNQDTICELNKAEDYKETVLGIVWDNKGKCSKYDRWNLVDGNYDILNDSEDKILADVKNVMRNYYKDAEEKEIKKVVGGCHRKDCYIKSDSTLWEARFDSNCEKLSISFWRDNTAQKPTKNITILTKSLIIYNTLTSYIICDTDIQEYYRLPKNRRVIVKRKSDHNNKIVAVN